LASRSRRRDLDRPLSVTLTIPPWLEEKEAGGSLLLVAAALRRLKVEPSGPRPVDVNIVVVIFMVKWRDRERRGAEVSGSKQEVSQCVLSS